MLALTLYYHQPETVIFDAGGPTFSFCTWALQGMQPVPTRSQRHVQSWSRLMLPTTPAGLCKPFEQMEKLRPRERNGMPSSHSGASLEARIPAPNFQTQ